MMGILGAKTRTKGWKTMKNMAFRCNSRAFRALEAAQEGQNKA